MLSRVLLCVRLLAASLVLAAAPLTMASGVRADDARIDGMMRAYDNPDEPGASVAVIKDGVLVHAKGYGLADVEGGVAADALTNYRLASLTKQFTAMAVLILKDKGLLSYDTLLTDVLADFPAYGRAITIRHLLGHTSGLRDYEDLIPSSRTVPLKDQDVVAILKGQRSTYFTPGSAYRYSNSGYATLAVVVEAVSGQSFSEFLAQNIFAPLGMDGTVAYENGINTVAHRAYGYTRSGSGFRRTDQSMTSAVLGDGGVYTSTVDWLKWDDALYTEQLVSQATLTDAFTSGRLTNGQTTGYGFGWQVGTYRGHRRASHTGSTIGFRTAVQRFPEQRLTVLVMINRANTTPWDIAERIADLYL